MKAEAIIYKNSRFLFAAVLLWLRYLAQDFAPQEHKAFAHLHVYKWHAIYYE